MTPVQKDKFDLANNFFGGYTYPSPLISIFINDNEVFIKRDDLLQLGCSKQRSIPTMIYSHLQKGETKFVVSSSGNAALISAFCAMQTSSIELMQVFLADTISDLKLQKFIDLLDLDYELSDLREDGLFMDNLQIKLVQDPRKMAFDQSKLGFINLRGSTDDFAISGFESISAEITIQIGENNDIDAIFVPASSGTTAIGVYQGFVNMSLNPQMHIIQTSKTHTLIKNTIPKILTDTEEFHSAESIVDIIGHRRKQIEEIIHTSFGKGWIITNEEVLEARSELESYGIYTSFDSALTFSAYKKASEIEIFRNPVLIFTG